MESYKEREKREIERKNNCIKKLQKVITHIVLHLYGFLKEAYPVQTPISVDFIYSRKCP